MAIKPVLCGGTAVYVPECDPCDMFEERVEALEECCDEARATLTDHEQRITANTNNITNLTNNLANNYYTKSQTYNQQEVNNLIGNLERVRIERVQTLPQTGDSNIIYLVPKQGGAPDIHDEYVWVNGGWEKIGDTQVDLSNYYNKSETDQRINAVPRATVSDGEETTVTPTTSGNTTDYEVDVYLSSDTISLWSAVV